MSLLDYQNVLGDEDDNYQINTWNEYDKLDAELQQSLLEINQICSQFSQSEEKNTTCSRLHQMAVGSAWIWWILAINLFWIQINMSNCQRLRICAAPVSGEVVS